MPETTLQELLERNDRHAASRPPEYFAGVQEQQRPAAVSVCCADSRVSQEGMWSIDGPGWLFTPSTIGNVVWDSEGGERFIDGSVLYPMIYTDTNVALVVGHTGCGAVTAALEAVRSGTSLSHRGIQHRIDLLIPVIEAGLEDERIRDDHPEGLVNQLVEFNVDRQVAFLRDSDDVPDDARVFGFVYDFQDVYGDTRGRAYLVNANGETAVDKLRASVPPEFASRAQRLLPEA